MQTITRLVFIFMLAISPFTQAESLADIASDWLTQQNFLKNGFNIQFLKNKQVHNDCKQNKYQLNVSQQLNESFNVQAILSYDKAVVDYGRLTQKLTLQTYELISWWQFENSRVGMSHKVLAKHEIASTMSDHYTLPTSRSFGIYFEMQGLKDSHLMGISAVREIWDAQASGLSLAWQTSQDNQLRVQYSISF